MLESKHILGILEGTQVLGTKKEMLAPKAQEILHVPKPQQRHLIGYGDGLVTRSLGHFGHKIREKTEIKEQNNYLKREIQYSTSRFIIIPNQGA